MPAGAKPYRPTTGVATAGATRRAVESAFHRHLDQQLAAEQAASSGAVVPPVEAPRELFDDELGRSRVPNRAERRRWAKQHGRPHPLDVRLKAEAAIREQKAEQTARHQPAPRRRGILRRRAS